MRFEKLSFRNIGSFRGEYMIDLTDIEGTLVAVTGGNGSGKSTLLGLLPGALFRDVPTRGSLADLATARDSYVEVTVCNGQRYTVRQLIDGMSGKGECLITDKHGASMVASGKLKDGDRWIAKHFLSASVLYSSSFAPQGRRGFLDMGKGERKQVLCRLLGLERLERLAESAREHAKSAKSEVDTLRARMADLPAADLAQLEQQVIAAQLTADTAAETSRGARMALERARAAAADVARAAELAEHRRAALKRLDAAKERMAGLETKIANNRVLQGRAVEIRGAVARAEELRRQLAAAKDVAAAAEGEHARLVSASKEAGAAFDRAAAAVGQADARTKQVETRLRDREAVRTAAVKLEAALAFEAAMASGIEKLESESVGLEQLVLRGKDQRISGLRDGLRTIRDEDFAESDGAPFQQWAANTLAKDDDLGAAAAAAPERLDATRKKLAECRGVHAQQLSSIAALERLAGRESEIAQAEADLAQAQSERTAASEALQAAKAARDAAADLRAASSVALQDAAAALAPLGAAIDALAATIALAPRLDQAEARIEELTSELVPARAAVEQCEAELATLPDVTAETVDEGGLAQAAARAELAEKAARETATRAAAALERAQQVETKRGELRSLITAAESEHSDWVRLTQDLGKDGLQAMELDAALPEINAISNELLHSCHGSRFTSELRTTRLSGDGKREIEDLEWRVIDVEKGRDADADTYSGGECVIVGEAVSLALTMLACRRAGVERPTIIRDESGAALDAQNGRAYLAMLRRAALQLGADRVLYVTHTPELQELADARIVIANGKIEVSHV